MKKTTLNFRILFICALTVFTNSCKTENIIKLPAVSTEPAITNITATTATSGGTVTDNQSDAVIARGVCFGKNINPTIQDNVTKDGTGLGSFTSSLTNLSPNSSYYVRAYATNKSGTAYGNSVNFTTNSDATVALTTSEVTGMTLTAGTSGGSITADGGFAVTDRGICWSINPNPTVNDNKLSSGTGTGNFVCGITNLALGNKYYVRAFATNSTGTYYGNEVAFSLIAKGADISWLPQMEATGYKFYNDQGNETDCIQILKDHGINSIRLRTWVNPSNDKASGHCSKDETVAMAVRAKNAGMAVMIDFHYSDSWADPSKQVKPAAWQNLSFEGLKQALYDYTADVMNALKTAGVTPQWVQVGNEIPSGFLYPEGSFTNWAQMVQLLNKGYDAVKAVSSTSKVILHIDRGNDNARFRWWFDAVTQQSAKYDIIGLSYYPYWLDGSPDYTTSIYDLGANMSDMVSRYGKEVMVVEVGGEDSKAQNTYDMLTAVLGKVRTVPGGKGLGVFYWEPEGARSWSNYPLSAWGSDGKPTIALDAFLK